MKKICLFMYACSCFSHSGYSQSLNQKMVNAIVAAIGGDLKGYKTFSYPTDNFGVITSYEKRVSDKRFLCDTWHCIGYNNAPKNANTWLDVYGYVVPSGGQAIQLDQETANSYGAEVALPKIADILNVGINFNSVQKKDVKVRLGKAYKRRLLKDSLIKYFNDPKVASSAKTAFLTGKLRLIVADLVIDDLSVEVTVNDTTTAELEAKLGKANSKVFNDASLAFKMQRVNKGTYKFSVDHPVIFAYLSKRQPAAGSLGTKRYFEDWIDDSNNFPNDPTMLVHQASPRQSTVSSH